MSLEKIPGIYNYCDRWCERCSFTSRCAVFDAELETPAEAKDINNKAFWERLSVNFIKAKDLLEQAAERYGIDLKTIAQEANDIDTDYNIQRREVESHPLALLSEEYSAHCMEWVQTQPGMIDKLEGLKSDLTIGIEDVVQTREKVEMIRDCVDVIQWYETFIHVKLMRALMGRIDDEEWPVDPEMLEKYGSDSDGSAKVALIGMDRSMQAWIKLYDLLPDEEDAFLKKLATIEKMKRTTLEEFPNALLFKRPGFDY